MPARRQSVISAMIPDLQDLSAKYPRHVGMAQGIMNPVWSLATTPETFLVAQALAALGFPPVSAIAVEVERMHRAGQVAAQWDLTKQFSGVAIAVLMESNGFANTGKKRVVPHDAWNVGACFSSPTTPQQTQAAPGTPNADATT
jgi:hypothetical protein